MKTTCYKIIQSLFLMMLSVSLGWGEPFGPLSPFSEEEKRIAGCESLTALDGIASQAIGLIDGSVSGGVIAYFEKKHGFLWRPRRQDNRERGMETNPLRFTALVPMQLQQFFRFVYFRKEQQVAIANSLEFNGRISAFNALAQSYGLPLIPLGFSEVSGQFGTREGNVRLFAAENLLPVKTSTGMILHDAPNHYFAIFIPVRYLRRASLQAEALVSFVDYLRDNTRRGGQADLEKAIKGLFSFYEEAIDLGTGNFSIAVQFTKRGNELYSREPELLRVYEEEQEELDDIKRLFEESFGFAMTPPDQRSEEDILWQDSYREETMYRQFSDTILEELLHQNLSPLEAIARAIERSYFLGLDYQKSQVQKRYLRMMLRRFSGTLSDDHPYLSQFEFNIDTLEQEIWQRIDEISSAVPNDWYSP